LSQEFAMHALPSKTASLLAALVVAGTAIVAAAPVHAQAVVCGDRVVVAFGDSLSQIARRCGTTVSAILAVNPLLPSPDFVFPGMTLLMPRAVAAPAPVPDRPAQGTAVRYVVKPGDTLSSISRSHNVPLTEIYRLNPDIDAASLRVGDVVRLPGGVVAAPRPGEPGPAQVVRYVVKPGDTLSAIARAHNLTLAQIYQLNPDIDFQRLRVGDVVRLPAGTVPPPRPAAATVSISPDRGAPGTVVQVSASGFPASAPLKLLAGRNAANLREFRPVTTDNRGRANVSIRIPDWAAGLRRIVFAFETPDGRIRSVSQPFRIGAEAPPASDRVSVTGTLTREGAECQAMRGDDGTLYTLAGDFRGFRPGDRVRVEGRIAEVSICMQGTTIDVRRIEDAG
jgi:LysM repeat protein